MKSNSRNWHYKSLEDDGKKTGPRPFSKGAEAKENYCVSRTEAKHSVVNEALCDRLFWTEDLG